MIPEELKIYKDYGIVYGLIDPDTKFLRYIGKSIVGIERAYHHLYKKSLNEGNTPKNNWIKKLKSNNKIYDVVVMFEIKKDLLPKEEMNIVLYNKEQELISEARPFGKLVNLCDGGPGATGRKISEETRQKMCSSQKIQDHTHLKKLAESQRNSPEKAARKKEEKRLKLKQRNRKIPGSRFLYSVKNGNKVIAKDINGNEIIGFYNLRGAAKLIGGKCSHTGIKMAIKSKKLYYGFIWEFLNVN